MPVAAFQEIFCEGPVEKMRLMGYYIVQNRDYRTMLFHMPGYESQRRCEI